MSKGIQGKENENKFFTVEFFGVSLIISSLLLLVCLLFGYSVLFELGAEIQFSLWGLFGYFSYPLLISLMVVGFMMLFGKKPSKSSVSTVLRLTLTLVLILSLFTTITNLKTTFSFSEYLSNAYNLGRNGLQKVVVGGALFSIITFPAVYNIGYVWSIVVFSVILFIDLAIEFLRIKHRIKNPKAKITVPEDKPSNEPNYQMPINNGYNQSNGQFNNNQGLNPYGNPPVNQPYNQPYNQPSPTYNQPSEPNYNHGSGYYGGFTIPSSNSVPPNFNAPSREEAMRILYGGPKTYSNAYSNSFNDDRVAVGGQNNPQNILNDDGMISSPISKEEITPKFTFEDNSQNEVETDYYDDYSSNEEEVDKYKPSESSKPSFINDFFKNLNNNGTSNEDIESNEPSFEEELDISSTFSNEPVIEPSFEEEVEPTVKKQRGAKKEENSSLSEYSKYLIENMPSNLRYKKPPISLLQDADKTDNNMQYEIFKNEIRKRILETLETFGVYTQIARELRGPAVTRFDIEVPNGSSMKVITNLKDEINLRIAAKNPIRMIAPVPGTSYIGIEVPNPSVEMVTLKDIVSSSEFNKPDEFALRFALGKDVIGNPVILNIATMPHALVTGTTGSGKSVCLNALIISLIMKYSPEELRFIIVDPKSVEFTPYEKLPHLYFGEIIKDDVPLTNVTLDWLVKEMDRRFYLFSTTKAKDIKSYNLKVREKQKAGIADDRTDKIIPRIVLIFDEFADVILKDKTGNVNKNICLLAQKSRAAGIHLVLAAQRPSVKIVEGAIKANIPTRLAFKAASGVDSKTSLDEYGAEKLLGRGDCLYKADGMFSLERAMGAYVNDEEIGKIADFVTENNKAYFDYNSWSQLIASVNSASDTQTNEGGATSSSNGQAPSSNMDALTLKAMSIGYDYGGLSVSFLQRKLGIGYNRSAKIVDWLTDNGYVSVQAVSGKKQMMLPREEVEEKFGPLSANGGNGGA